MSRASIDQLFVHNPMLVEIARFRRKYLSLRGTGIVTTVFFGAIYGLLLLVVIRFADNVEPGVVLFTELGLACFIAPAILHSAIAGEREKRTWDFLLVAPVTRAQIVVGKFIAAVQGIIAMALLMLLPLGVTLLGQSARYQRETWGWDGYSRPTTGLYDTLLAGLLIATFAIMLCAMTLFFSARCKRSLMALGASLGAIVVAFALFPALTLPLPEDSFEWKFWIELGNLFNPFVAVSHVLDRNPSYYEGAIPAAYYGWTQIGFYVLATIGFLAWAIKTVHWPDNEKKFIGGKRARG